MPQASRPGFVVQMRDFHEHELEPDPLHVVQAPTVPTNYAELLLCLGQVPATLFSLDLIEDCKSVGVAELMAVHSLVILVEVEDVARGVNIVDEIL